MLAKSDNDMFIPKKLETTVKYEGKNLSSYTVLDSDAPNAERVHALLCNRHAAAAEASNLGPYTRPSLLLPLAATWMPPLVS
jgi:hypothetical protein